MPRQKKSTAVHRSGHEKDIRKILKDKGMREGFKEYTDTINQEFGTSLSTRQVRYYYNNYVKPREVITPEEAEGSIEDRRELINVAAEQMDLYELQKERVEEMLDVEDIRGDNRTMLHDRDDGVSDDMVVFKFSDSATFWDARHISLRLKHYNEAYMKLNIDEHMSKALEQSLRNHMAQIEDDVEVIYSSITPRKYDFAIKEVVQDWPGKDENGPDVVFISHVLEKQGVL